MSDVADGSINKDFLERILLLDDALACVATIHLCAEYWINRIIGEKSPSATEILGDPRSHSFEVKLAILWDTGLLPEPLCRNIKKLNDLRGKCVHDLDVDFTRMDLDYEDPDGRVNLEQFRERLVSGDDDTIKAVLRWVGMFTFGWLSKHCAEELEMKG